MPAISPDIISGPFTGNGAQTAFTFTFSIAEESEIAVSVDGAAVSSSLYVVSLVGEGGTVTFDSAPANGAKVLLSSAPDYLQASSFETEGAYSLATVNTINRRASIRDLVLKGQVDRALKVPLGTAAPDFPDLDEAEGRVLGYAGGQFIWAPNDEAAVASDVARAEAAADDAEADAAQAGGDAATASAAADRAELARDAAVISAGIYANEAAGRAAVADGVRFSAVGASSDKAVDIWQRVNSAGSTLLRSYPSLAALNAALDDLSSALGEIAAASAETAKLKIRVSNIENEDTGDFSAAKARELETERMQDPFYYVDLENGSDGAGRGGRSYKAMRTFDYAYAAVSGPYTTTPSSSLLLRNGQQHLVTPTSDGNNLYMGSIIGTTGYTINIGGFGGDGAYGASLDTRMPLAGQAWTASGGSWVTNVTLHNPLSFGGLPGITGVHMQVWHVPDPGNDVLGTLAEWKTGGANPAANDTAVGAASDFAFSFAYAGQSAGEIRGTGHSGTDYILRVKMADGSDPTGQPLFLTDFASGISFLGGRHGHVVILPTVSKDTCDFYPDQYNFMPWFESLTIIGTPGHSGVGPKSTVGKFTGHGVPTPGEAAFATGQTSGGGGCHNFTQGKDMRTHYLYNGSLDIKNQTIGCYIHGGGGGPEGYRGWIVRGDILMDNCTTGFNTGGLLLEGFKHYGRLLMTEGTHLVETSGEPLWRLAGSGGSFKGKNSQVCLVTCANTGNPDITIGSDDPTETFILDCSDVTAIDPNYNAGLIYTRVDSASVTPAPTITLKGVVDETIINAGTGTYKMGLMATGFYPNAPYVNLVLIRSRLGDLWRGNNYATSDSWPRSLYVDGESSVGFNGRNWANIEAAYAALGWPCTILAGAQAIDSSGNVVDTK